VGIFEGKTNETTEGIKVCLNIRYNYLYINITKYINNRYMNINILAVEASYDDTSASIRQNG